MFITKITKSNLIRYLAWHLETQTTFSKCHVLPFTENTSFLRVYALLCSLFVENA